MIRQHMEAMPPGAQTHPCYYSTTVNPWWLCLAKAICIRMVGHTNTRMGKARVSFPTVPVWDDPYAYGHPMHVLAMVANMHMG